MQIVLLPLLACSLLGRNGTALAASVARLVPQDSAASGAPAVPAFSDAHVVLWQPGVENAYPHWSRDGRRILYQSNRSGKWQIRVMDADGTNDRALTSGEANDNFPDWSPDNERIAFVSDRDGNEEIYVMRMDGSELVDVSRHAARDIHPYWSPDGRKLLFNSTRAVERLQIYEVSPDGTDLRRLVESEDDDSCAHIEPSGAHILHLANLASGQDDVILRRRDGSEPRNLTHDAAPDGWPAWTPDGHVVFSSARGGRFALFLMDANGDGARRLTSPAAGYEDARACAAPDGKQILFNRGDGRTIGICTLDLS